MYYTFAQWTNKEPQGVDRFQVDSNGKIAKTCSWWSWRWESSSSFLGYSIRVNVNLVIAETGIVGLCGYSIRFAPPRYQVDPLILIRTLSYHELTSPQCFYQISLYGEFQPMLLHLYAYLRQSLLRPFFQRVIVV